MPPIPQEAVAYLERKKLAPGFSYKDVWTEEHAVAFTVAKCMQMDVLGAIKDKLVDALKRGTGLAQFTKELEPYLQRRGWWGTKLMLDAKTKQFKKSQLGSARRLATIWRVNTRSAYMAGVWERSQASELHPYLMWQVGPVRTKHRDQHLKWNGTVLPKDDPWWQTHMPPLGYNCNCRVVMVSEARLARLKTHGVPNPVVDKYGYSVGGRRKIHLKRPKTTYTQYTNRRTGAVRHVPDGVTPGFEWNQGASGRSVPLALALMEKAEKVKGRGHAQKVMREYLAHPIMRGGYNAFVRTALEKEKSTGRVVPVGLLADTYLAYAESKGKRPASGLVVMSEKLLIQKQEKHKMFESDLTKEQWLMLPDILQNPERVYWDTYTNNQSLVFTKQTEKGILMMPIKVGGIIRNTSLEVLSSAYIVGSSYEKMDASKRFERIE